MSLQGQRVRRWYEHVRNGVWSLGLFLLAGCLCGALSRRHPLRHGRISGWNSLPRGHPRLSGELAHCEVFMALAHDGTAFGSFPHLKQRFSTRHKSTQANGGTAPLILNLATVYSCEVSCTPRLLNPHGKDPPVAVAYRGGVWGVQPPPRNSEGPPNRPRLNPVCENC